MFRVVRLSGGFIDLFGSLGLPLLEDSGSKPFAVVIKVGVGRLPQLGGAVGESIREFRSSVKDEGVDVR